MLYVPQQMTRRVASAVSATLLLLAVAACQTDGGPKPQASPVWPPEGTARYAWEKSIRSSGDVVEETNAEKLRRMATGESTAGRSFEKPYGVVAYDGYLFVSDTVTRSIHAYDMRAKRYWSFGDKGVGSLAKPLDLAVANDQVYICDASGQRIVVFDFQGNYKGSIGEPGDLVRPSGIAVSRDGSRLYVIDTGGVESDKHRVVVYDAAGNRISEIGKRGTEHGEFNLPVSAVVGPSGQLYVVDGGNFRVQVFDENGRFQRSIGSIGRKSGQFARPKGIGADRDGNVYVTDSSFANFQIFTGDGQLLLDVGGRGEDGGPGEFMLPAGIAVDPTDGRIYVVDQFFRKVEVFRPAGTPEQRQPRQGAQAKPAK